MKTVGTFAEARDLAVGAVGLVPTMGFLHEGHLSLIDAARKENNSVVVSLFVNPLQFNEDADLAAYPRNIDRDTALAQAAGADVLFRPDTSTMYSTDPRSTVEVRGVSDAMEGAHRPGHFEGVATVVAKLFAGIQPDTAYFGRKDAQQLALVTTMAADLSFPVSVRGLPIVRESDGLALSSRNILLRDEDRPVALGLSSSLFAASTAFEAGERSASVLCGIVHDELDKNTAADVEYVNVARASNAQLVDDVDVTSFLALAARVGDVRLIDNVFLDPNTERADRGIRLTKPTILYGDD